MKLPRVIFTITQAAIAVVVLAVISVLLVEHFGFIKTVKPLVVMSGSMEPTIKLGSVVLIKPQNSYRTNEIVTFTPSGNSKNLVTHRIIHQKYKNKAQGSSVYLTAGDANKEIDQSPVKEEQILGKVFLSIPYLGYLVNVTKKPYGFILFVIVPATIVIYEELKSSKKELSRLLHRLKAKRKVKEFSINLLSKKPLPLFLLLAPPSF